jgi:hypothetical protein
MTGVGQQVDTCDDCGPCGVQTVMSVQLMQGDYWCVPPATPASLVLSGFFLVLSGFFLLFFSFFPFSFCS